MRELHRLSSRALLALLVGATRFNRVLRAFATDAWLADLIVGSSLPPKVTALLVLLAVAACAWVLDAFEMIFVIIPIVAPPPIAELGDAQQTAVLLLLALQLSFLLPPMGHDALMARARMVTRVGSVPLLALMRALAPCVAAQAIITCAVFLWPAMVHQLDAPAPLPAETAVPSDADVIQQMREIGEQQAHDPDIAPTKPVTSAPGQFMP